ncbi:MAG: hypothetical protein RIC14_13755 [Filomicrobium sp.]
MKNVIAISLVAGIVAGCAAKPLEVGSITPIKPLNGASGTDVYAQQRAAGSAVPDFGGAQLLEVRTYERLEDKGRVEMAGANCTLSAGTFEATMSTPAKVRVPLYRSQSESLAVQCAKAGYKTRLVTLKPFDHTRAQRYSNMNAAAAGGGVIGLVTTAAVAGIIDATADNTKNVWNYPAAQIELEREK